MAHRQRTNGGRMKRSDFKQLPNFTYYEILLHYFNKGFSRQQAEREIARIPLNWFKKLQKVRTQINKKIRLNCLTEGSHKPRSWHFKAKAGDWHVVGPHNKNKVLQACIDAGFKGIGFYPFWNKPGFHTDTRPGGIKLWKREKNGKYKGLI